MPPWRRYSRGAEHRVWLVLALALALVPLQPAALKARPRLADTRPVGLYLLHPRLARTVPSSGKRLTSAPTALRLTFTEVPELTFTRLTLSGPPATRFGSARRSTRRTTSTPSSRRSRGPSRLGNSR